MPRLVKARDLEPDDPLAAFPPDQRAALLAWAEARQVRRVQIVRDIVQGFGAIVAALKRLADEN